MSRINAADLVSIESELAVAALIAQHELPRSFHWLYKRSDDFTRAHMPSVIDRLCDQGKIAANGDGTWTRQDEVVVAGVLESDEFSIVTPSFFAIG